MSYYKTWGDFTFLFKTKKPNPIELPTYQYPDPVTYARRKKIEELQEQRDLQHRLADVWD